MNIFALHKYPAVAVAEYCDQHVAKMASETAQLLAPIITSPARPMAKTHICARAVIEQPAIAVYCADLQIALFREFRNRTGRFHAYDTTRYEYACNVLIDNFQNPIESADWYPLAFVEEFRKQHNIWQSKTTSIAEWIDLYKLYYQYKLKSFKRLPRYFGSSLKYHKLLGINL